MTIASLVPFIFAGLIGMAALAFALAKAIRQIKDAEETIRKAATRRQAQVDRIKRTARTTLRLAREIRDARKRKASLEFNCTEIEERLKAANAVDRRLYILDDRRTASDAGWRARVVNPDFAARVNPNTTGLALASWRRGRTFLVWALDEAKARQKILARFPDHKGFAIRDIDRYDD